MFINTYSIYVSILKIQWHFTIIILVKLLFILPEYILLSIYMPIRVSRFEVFHFEICGYIYVYIASTIHTFNTVYTHMYASDRFLLHFRCYTCIFDHFICIIEWKLYDGTNWIWFWFGCVALNQSNHMSCLYVTNFLRMFWIIDWFFSNFVPNFPFLPIIFNLIPRERKKTSKTIYEG